MGGASAPPRVHCVCLLLLGSYPNRNLQIQRRHHARRLCLAARRIARGTYFRFPRLNPLEIPLARRRRVRIRHRSNNALVFNSHAPVSIPQIQQKPLANAQYHAARAAGAEVAVFISESGILVEAGATTTVAPGAMVDSTAVAGGNTIVWTTGRVVAWGVSLGFISTPVAGRAHPSAKSSTNAQPNVSKIW
jgi:hypothetical protein